MKPLHTIAICSTILCVGFFGFNYSNASTGTIGQNTETQKWEYLFVFQVDDYVQNDQRGIVAEDVYAFDTKKDEWVSLVKGKTLIQALDIIGNNGWEFVNICETNQDFRTDPRGWDFVYNSLPDMTMAAHPFQDHRPIVYMFKKPKK